MISFNKEAPFSSQDIWVISQAKYIDPSTIKYYGLTQSGHVKEYRISDLARYLLNPNSIEVKRKLVEGEVSYQKPRSESIKEKIKHFFAPFMKNPTEVKPMVTESLSPQYEVKTSSLKDAAFKDHLEKLYAQLRPYDPMIKRIATIDSSKVGDIKGICEDKGGVRTWLNLQGPVEDKLKYIAHFILKDVGVVLEKARLSEGLFEMSGFDFQKYNPIHSYKVIKFLDNGQQKACVLNAYNKIDFWIDTIDLLHCMQLLEQSIRENQKFRDSLKLCLEGKATPLKMLFTKKFEMDYSQSYLPQIYKEVFKNFNLGSDKRAVVINSLKNLQFCISFNYIPHSSLGEKKFYTNISIMHDFKALEPLKNDLPQLYSEINKRATLSEGGKFYLLDSIKGCKDEY